MSIKGVGSEVFSFASFSFDCQHDLLHLLTKRAKDTNQPQSTCVGLLPLIWGTTFRRVEEHLFVQTCHSTERRVWQSSLGVDNWQGLLIWQGSSGVFDEEQGVWIQSSGLVWTVHLRYRGNFFKTISSHTNACIKSENMLFFEILLVNQGLENSSGSKSKVYFPLHYGPNQMLKCAALQKRRPNLC